MLWRIFSGLVGICSYATLALGVSSSHAAAPWTIVGYIGAVFIAVAVGSYTAALRSGHPSSRVRRNEPRRPMNTVVGNPVTPRAVAASALMSSASEGPSQWIVFVSQSLAG